jgi:parallel beta-helix repeat protein
MVCSAPSQSFVFSPRSLVFILAALLLPSWAAAQSTTDWTYCAPEHASCAFTGTQEVRYGANGGYVIKTLTDGTACSNAVFGDPIVGTLKACYTRPADWTFCAVEGAFCAFTGAKEVRYGANGLYRYRTISDGTACTNAVFGDSVAGTRKQCDIRQASTTTATSPPPSAVGPQTSITCPAGALNVWPGEDIQGLVNLFPGTTTFCLNPGVYTLRSAITPKSGNTFVGRYGAILDGAGWTTDDPAQGAFRAHNEDIDDVTIRNLVIRKMPKRGIHAYYWMSDRWTIEYNEIAFNQTGVSVPNNSVVRNNYIHDNAAGGYSGFKSSNVVFEGNEIAYNGSQKVLGATNITFRNNFVHHNLDDGIWYDGDSTIGLVEGNIVEDNGREGIFAEITSRVVIRNNTVRRNAYSGIFISTSKDMEVSNNTLEDNFRGIQLFLNCAAVGGGRIGWDLANTTVRDNVINVGTASGSFANGLSHVSSCTATQVAPYLSGLKGLTFVNNRYSVPSMTTKYWLWGFGALHVWNEWQALGNDAAGTARAQ